MSEEIATVEVDIVAAGEKDARRFGISSDEERYGTWNRRANAGGEQTDIVTVAVG